MYKHRQFSSFLWNNSKFATLSDQAKLSYFFLYTHPHLTAFGAMRANLPGLAYEIGWDIEQFNAIFAELLEAGFVLYDESASFVWLPRFLEDNLPKTEKDVLLWEEHFEALPECDLRNMLLDHIKQIVISLPAKIKRRLSSFFLDTKEEVINKQIESLKDALFTVPLQDGSEYPIFQKDINEWQDAFPDIDVLQELKTLRQWNIANPQKRKTKRGFRKHVITWLTNAVKRQQTAAQTVLGKNGYSADFRKFWQHYPRQAAPLVAWEVWQQLEASRLLPELSVLLGAIEEQKKSEQWRQGYIPEPARWLREGRWEDKLPEKTGDEGSVLEYAESLKQKLAARKKAQGRR